MTRSLADEVLERARGDDPTCADLLGRVDDPETLGELIVAAHATGTAIAARAVQHVLRRPFRRGAWQGFKRLFKLLEARLRDDEQDPPAHDVELFAELVFTLDGARWGTSPVSPRTLEYMQRRAYRAVKALAHRRPARLRALLTRLVPRYAATSSAGTSTLLARVLRGPSADVAAPAQATRFVAPVENAYAALPTFAGPDLLALGDDDLVRPAPVATDEPPALAAPPAPWRGPIFVERWVEDPAWLIDLLERTRYEPAVLAIVRLCEERAGDALLAVELERFYALLRHPVAAAWRLGLSQVAARARHDRLRWGELARLLERAARETPPDWAVIADVLAVMDASGDAAEAEWPGLLPALHDLLVAHTGAPGVDPIVELLRRRLFDRLLPPLFGWRTALTLAAAPRPLVRALGRELIAGCADLEVLDADLIERLLGSALPEDDPDLVHRVLVRPRAHPGGYRPALMERTTRGEVRPEPWPLSRCATALDRLPEAGFQALRRALLAFEDDSGLDPRVALTLIARPERRTRTLGLELLGSALARGAYSALELPRLLAAPREDVVVWARERLEADAAAGRLPNEALYRILDQGAADAQAFGRDLVRAHLERFALAELIVFCAESPDAATSDLGIGLYEQRLKGHGVAPEQASRAPRGASHGSGGVDTSDDAARRPRGLRRTRHTDDGFDLRTLVPMFRILLYRPATARAEKERLYGTLRRWALEAPDHARLVVDVTGELRRTESQVDRSRVVQLLALIADRFAGEVEVPFRTTAAFDGRKAGSWTSR